MSLWGSLEESIIIIHTQTKKLPHYSRLWKSLTWDPLDLEMALSNNHGILQLAARAVHTE